MIGSDDEMDFKFNKSNLNFRVYSATEVPETGSENDVVIITDVQMSNWVMSPDKPSGIPRSDGDVWIQYSVTGDVFNVLKNNTMMIATISAWQYVNGAWKAVEAKRYQDGEWVYWIRYIFRSGEGETIPLKVYKQSDVTVIVDDNCITQNSATTGNLIAKIQTENPLSLTNKNVIYARVKCVRKHTSEAFTARLAISHDAKDDFNGNTEIASVYFQNDSKETIYEIPVTTSGSYYVYIWGVGEYTLYDWWIE